MLSHHLIMWQEGDGNPSHIMAFYWNCLVGFWKEAHNTNVAMFSIAISFFFFFFHVSGGAYICCHDTAQLHFCISKLKHFTFFFIFIIAIQSALPTYILTKQSASPPKLTQPTKALHICLKKTLSTQHWQQFSLIHT